MKKILFMAVMAIVAMTASAQIEKGLRFGITVSGSMSKYSEINGAKNTFGCGDGLTVEYSFNPNVYLGTGLQFGLRGTKVDALEVSGQTISVDGSLKSYNIVLPVNIGGRINVSDNFSIFGQVGPYVSFAAKKAELQTVETVTGEAFDWGFNAKVGVEIRNQFQIFGGYELGMKEVWPNDAKNRSIVFGLAYMF